MPELVIHHARNSIGQGSILTASVSTKTLAELSAGGQHKQGRCHHGWNQAETGATRGDSTLQTQTAQKVVDGPFGARLRRGRLDHAQGRPVHAQANGDFETLRSVNTVCNTLNK
jgi:hypothetical protein